MTEYRIIWKYLNDLWVRKYACRTSTSAFTAVSDYEEYRSNRKYKSVRIEIDWKRVSEWELYAARAK